MKHVLFYIACLFLLSFILGCSTNQAPLGYILDGGQMSDATTVNMVRQLGIQWGDRAFADRLISTGGPITIATVAAASSGIALAGGNAAAVAWAVSAMAWVGEVFRIFDSPSRLRAHNTGVRMLRLAVARYVKEMVKQGVFVVPSDRTTVAGALLLWRVVWAMNAVDSIVEGTFPSEDEVRALVNP